MAAFQTCTVRPSLVARRSPSGLKVTLASPGRCRLGYARAASRLICPLLRSQITTSPEAGRPLPADGD